MNITDFLLARIAEDVDEIGPASDCDCDVEGLPLRHGVRCPVPMLADCEAKQRIVGSYLGDILKPLALRYADHPDFDAAWRP